MIVRQYVIISLIVLFVSPKEAFSQDTLNINDDDVSTDITKMNKKLERYVNEGDLEGLINLYLKDAYLLIPGKTYDGQKEIREYWEEIENPLEWQLEVVDVEMNEREIYNNQYYEALDNKPPGWRQRGIELDDDKPMVYQIGRSILNVKEKNEHVKSSEANHLIVWQVQPDGSYRILIDAYSWN